MNSVAELGVASAPVDDARDGQAEVARGADQRIHLSKSPTLATAQENILECIDARGSEVHRGGTRSLFFFVRCAAGDFFL